MRVLVVGNGARDHAIAWKLSLSQMVTELFVAPGNAGTAQVATNVSIGVNDIEALVRFARDTSIDLAAVGPEAPLAAGIADRFQQAGVPIFGPTRDAALIESSKSFAKQIMLDAGVPTAGARVFCSYAEASAYVDASPYPVVIKADGLAAGKGVTVAATRDQALEALRAITEERRFGPAGDKVLVEEFLEGREVSVFAFVDGANVSPMVAACDYKRLGDGDAGPNTGGMGSFSPPDVWDDDLELRVRNDIMEPVVAALSSRGSPFRGTLYAGLVLTANGPKVLEFNCRLGDPESQVILPRLKTDLADVMVAAAQGGIRELAIEWDPRACVGIVAASGGYPNHYVTDNPISGLEDLEDAVMVFHGGTKATQAQDGTCGIVTDGGRVLTVAALGDTLDEARRTAYANLARIRFQGVTYRKDIAAVG